MFSQFVSEYRSFEFYKADDTYVLMLDAQPLITFPSRQLMEAFCDQAYEFIDKIIEKELKLHITGCMRCKRTYENRKIDPCKTGIPMFIRAKEATVKLLKATAEAVLADRQASREEETAGANI